jgi:hypothetical protein
MARQMHVEMKSNTEPDARAIEYKGRTVGLLCVRGLSGSDVGIIVWVTARGVELSVRSD